MNNNIASVFLRKTYRGRLTKNLSFYEFLRGFERVEFLRMTKGIQKKWIVFLRKTYRGILTKNLLTMRSFEGLKD